jgi:hypothetical protein
MNKQQIFLKSDPVTGKTIAWSDNDLRAFGRGFQSAINRPNLHKFPLKKSEVKNNE